MKILKNNHLLAAQGYPLINQMAVIDLNKLEIKKPKANTQKIKILLFALLIIYISLLNHYYE